MATTWLEAIPADHKRFMRVIVKELVNGRNRAREIQSLLNNRGGGSSSRSVEELVMEIVTSFTEILSVLRESSLAKLFGGDDHYSATTEIVKVEQSHVEHSHCGDRSFEDSGESKKRTGLKDRRGCYKRRKNSESWTTVSPTVEDSQAWRKYGQKEILNATYPRFVFHLAPRNEQQIKEWLHDKILHTRALERAQKRRRKRSVASLQAEHKRVIVKELVNGRNRARKLQFLLNKRGGGSSSRSVEELVMEIVTSFTEILSVLRESSSAKLFGGDDHFFFFFGEGGDDHYSATTEIVKVEQSHAEHSHCGDRSFEDSGESKKRTGLKDRRGCYKRRKNSESWTTVSPTVEDGQAWRKYGQKEILNATYPRAYFRCTRKYDQGCQATKQVQQIKDNPKVYKTTYIGNHTCKMIRVPQMIMDASDPPALDSHAPPRATVSSESGSICNKNEHHGDHGGHISSSLSMIPILPVKKEESKEGKCLTDNLNDTSDMWPEYDFGFPEATVRSDENVVSDMQFLDMDLGKSINFEFDFDEVAFS